MSEKFKMLSITPHEIDSLKASEYNPRKISERDYDILYEGISTFGLVEPIIINMQPGREKIIISGHQRWAICKELGYEMVACNELFLTLEMEKQLNIRMNKNGGKFDQNLLQDFFDKNDLLKWGFLDSDFPEIIITEKIIGGDDEDPVYPIVPVLSEKYDYVIIIAKNEIDIAYLDNFFELRVEKSYKKPQIGKGRVVTFERFKEKISDERIS